MCVYEELEEKKRIAREKIKDKKLEQSRKGLKK